MLTKEHKKELLQKISFIKDLNTVIQNYIRQDLEFSYLVLYNKTTDIVREYIISKNKYEIIVDARPCHINSLKRNLIELANIVMTRNYDINVDDVNKMLNSNDWEVVENTISYCPYCGSPNIEAIDNMEDSNKYICHNCNEDFILWNDGEVTDRHNRVIEIKEYDLDILLKKYHVTLNEIKYCIEEEDIIETVERNYPNVEEDSDEWYELINQEINNIKSKLPSSLTYDIEDVEDEDEAKEEAINMATESTGWLIEVSSISIKEIKDN